MEQAEIPQGKPYMVNAGVRDVLAYTEDYWKEMVKTGFFDDLGVKVGEAIGREMFGGVGAKLGRFAALAGSKVGMRVTIVPSPTVVRDHNRFVSKVRLQLPRALLAQTGSLEVHSTSQVGARGTQTLIAVRSTMVGPHARTAVSALGRYNKIIQDVMQQEMAHGLERYIKERGARGPGRQALAS